MAAETEGFGTAEPYTRTTRSGPRGHLVGHNRTTAGSTSRRIAIRSDRVARHPAAPRPHASLCGLCVRSLPRFCRAVVQLRCSAPVSRPHRPPAAPSVGPRPATGRDPEAVRDSAAATSAAHSITSLLQYSMTPVPAGGLGRLLTSCRRLAKTVTACRSEPASKALGIVV